MPDIKIGRLNGGLCVYWWGDDGKRRRFGLVARTRTEAEAEAIDVYRREAYQNAPKGSTVAQLWAAYVDDLGERPTAKTMGYTGKAVLPHFGALRPDQITREHCKDYMAMRVEAGISQGSVFTELGHLRSTMKFAEKTRMIDRAPYIWKPTKPEKDKRILNAGEVSKLIDACGDPHVRLAVTLLFGTAARVGAILDLEWDRVDFERGTINLRLDDAVTRKGRAVVPMNGMTRAALLVAHKAALTDYVVEYNGGRINSIRKGFVSAVERSGIGHVTIHECRHTAAVTMLAAGVSMSKVSQALGHSNIATTERVYARYQPSHLQDAVDVLDFGKLRSVK